jgi:hypothetical protein
MEGYYDNGSWHNEDLLNSYKEWKQAEFNNWLLPDNVSIEKRIAAQKEEREAKMIFDYAHVNLDASDEKLYVRANKKQGLPTEELLSLVYDRFFQLIETIEFCNSSEKDFPNLPENIIKAVKDGKVSLQGYNLNLIEILS